MASVKALPGENSRLPKTRCHCWILEAVEEDGIRNSWVGRCF